ncbi:MAG: PD-(D/E)XK nuclease family protein [Bacteroidota bacterium]
MPTLLFNKAYSSKFSNSSAEIDLLCFDTHSMMDYFIEKKKPKSMLLVLPTRRMVLFYKNHFIRKYFERHKQPCEPPSFHTFESFVLFCHKKIFQNKKTQISEPFIYALIEEAIKNSQLEFFRHNPKNKRVSFSLVTKIAQIINGLKEDGISPDDLFNDVENYSPQDYIDYNIGGVSDPKKLHDFAVIYKKYQELLSDKFLDSPQYLIDLNDFFQQNISSEFLLDKFFDPDSVILFDKFSEFKHPQATFLKLLSQSTTPVAINVDFSPINGPLFGNLTETISDIQINSYSSVSYLDVNEKLTIEDEINLPPSQYLRRRLFNNEEYHEINYNKLNDTIKVIACENQVDEVNIIAKLVHYLIEQGYAPTDIAIVSRKPELYSPLFREIFASNNIESFITDRFDLSASQLVITFFNIIDLIINNYRKSDLKKVLQSSYFRTWANSFIEVENLLEVITEVPFLGGTKSNGAEFWCEMLSFNIKYFENSLLADDNENSDSYHTQKKKQKYEKALVDFRKLVEMFSFENRDYFPQEILSLIKNQIINKLNIKEQLINKLSELKQNKSKISILNYIFLRDEIEKDVAAVNSFVQLVDEYSKIQSILYPQQKINLSEFIDKIKIVALNTKFNIKESADRGVKITSIEQIIGIPFKVVILCGAVDGDFPLAYRSENTLGKILPKSELRHLESERILFYKTLTNNAELFDKGQFKLFITYPEFFDREEQIMSTFISALFNVTSLAKSNKFYKLSTIRKAIATNSIAPQISQQLKEIPFINYISDRGELIRKFAAGELSQPEIISLIDAEALRKENERIEKYLSSLDDETSIFGSNLPPDLLNFLSEYSNKTYSVSEFETFQKCRYNYFLRYILGIRERTDETEEISNIEVGNLLHRIVYKFMTSIKNELPNSDFYVKLDENQKDKYWNLLVNLAKQELEFYKFFDYEYHVLTKFLIGDFGNKSQKFSSFAQNRGLLYLWLERELLYQAHTRKLYPAFFELSFGSKKLKDFPVTIDDIKIRGKIDRIDLHVNKSVFLIVDYKKSSPKKIKENASIFGDQFQIPVYIKAAEQILPDLSGVASLEPIGGAYFCFTPGAINSKKNHRNEQLEKINKTTYFPLISPEYNFLDNENEQSDEKSIADHINSTIEQIKEIVKQISQGLFGEKNNRNQKICENCNYTNLCRINKHEIYNNGNENENEND